MRQFEWRWLYDSVWSLRCTYLSVWVTGGYMGPPVLHAFVCKMAPSRITRLHALNDIISRAFASAKIPVTKEPSGLFRSDGKRPDGLTLIPWQRGLFLTWDVTVATTLHWQTPIFRHLHPQLAPQLRWRRPENKPSTPHYQGHTCSSRLLWKLWTQSTNRLAILKRSRPCT